MRSRRSLAFLAFAATALLLTGCVTPRDKSRQLARVAKDWCLTIRASQVIPVYPPTRDVHPGDVFLTTTPIGEEVKLFEENGFLPLDVHLVRLKVDDQVKSFYATRPGEGAEFPNSVATWEDLPACAFPTYSFEVSRSGGLNLAIPVQGVPVGFNYLGAAAATGTVTLSEAQTVGLDIATLQPLLENWEKQNGRLLAAYAWDPGDPAARPVYVRVVARVYRVRSISVQLSDAARAGAQLAAGLELPTPDPGAPSASKTAAEQYDEVAKRLDTTLVEQLGGQVRVVKVARRSVLLTEKFRAPMAIGYLAYDCLILPGGLLSGPMPTYQRITGASIAAPGVLNSAAFVEAWYTADEATRVQRIREWIEANVMPQNGQKPAVVDILSSPAWDTERRRMIRDLGMFGP